MTAILACPAPPVKSRSGEKGLDFAWTGCYASRMPAASPTALSLRFLREQGFLAQTVERWIPTRDPGAEGRRAGLLKAAAHLRDRAARMRARRSPGGSSAWNAADSAEWLIGSAEQIETTAGVEQEGPPGRRVDLFGLIDILCLDGQPGCLGVQACAYSGISRHVKEIREGTVKLPAVGKEPAFNELKCNLAIRWLRAGNRLSIFGWQKKDNRWTPRIVEITAATLEG